MSIKRFTLLVATAWLVALACLIMAPTTVQAGIYNADSEVTYKEYWVPHSQFKGGDDELTQGCQETNPTGTFYLEPFKNCDKSVTFTIPDDFSGALRAEIYLDLWRNYEPTYITRRGQQVLEKKASAAFQINGSSYVYDIHPLGDNYSRTPYVADTVRATDKDGNVIPASITPLKTLLRQGENTIVFKAYLNPDGSARPYHVHDIAIRIYFDEAHPLRDPSGQPIQAPDGELTTIWHDAGLANAYSGGMLLVDDDQLVLEANLTTPASFIEFHGYYRGYDEDNNDADNDGTALDTDWHNRGHLNWHPGGEETQLTGGTIDHIGSTPAPHPGRYRVYWNLTQILSQPDVRFKLRIVNDHFVVREAAGGVSAPFTLQRTKTMVAYSKPNWQDFIIWLNGTRPATVTVPVDLPTNLVVSDYQEAYVLGSYWQTPFLSVNGSAKFRVFAAGEDNWTLSIRRLEQPGLLLAGRNQFTYSYNTGVGHFVEKPGPLVILKQTTRAPDNQPPQLLVRNPPRGAAEIDPGTNITVTLADPGRGLDWRTIQLWVNGAAVTPQFSGSPDSYTLVYDPPIDFLPNSAVTVQVAACDFANKCISGSAADWSFRTTREQYSFTATPYGRGLVDWTPRKRLYKYGDVVALAVTPSPDWNFTGWSLSREEWGDSARRYRLPVRVGANGYARTDKLAELPVNFTTLLTDLGEPGAFDPDTLRVVEVGATGQLLDDAIPFQFDPGPGYDATTNAAGTLLFLLKGATAANAQRHYWVYFDRAGSGLTAPTFPDLVERSEVVDEGQESYRFATANATWFYHKLGGGFSSLVDVDGNDWLGHHPTPQSGAGFFRGLPNMVPPPDGLFHPGNNIGVTTPVNGGPLKETIRTVTHDGLWETRWEIFPTYARATVVQKDPAKRYWFLYEGTPGGENPANADRPCATPNLCPYEYSDTYTLASGFTTTLNNRFSGDLPGPEWIYFSDPDVDGPSTAARSLFLANHLDDTAAESFQPDSATAPKMTIFGFGRSGEAIAPFINRAPQSFTVGLMDETAYGPASAIINNAYQDLLVNAGGVEALSIPSNPTTPISYTITGNAVVTATLLPSVYFALAVEIVGQGVVLREPNFPVYPPGEPVTLTATAASGWYFAGWSGAITGTAPVANLVVNDDTNVTATFLPLSTLAVGQVGDGNIVIEPLQEGYRQEQTATLTATPAVGWRFVRWAGNVGGVERTANPINLVMDVSRQVTATFELEPYSITTDVVGQGSIERQPQQATYFYGDVVTVTAQANPGWFFTGWRGALSGGRNPAPLTVTGNTILTAVFSDAPVTLTANPLGEGRVVVTPTQELYAPGDRVTIGAQPDPGWLFSGWSGDLVGAANPTALTLDVSKVITASFVRSGGYTISVTVDGNGAVSASPDQADYLFGDTVALTAVPDPGWRFSGWAGDMTSSDNPLALVMERSWQLVANFTAIAITKQVEGEGAISLDPDKPVYNQGEVVAVTATPATGWAFLSWGGDLSGAANPTQLAMDGGKTITAQFGRTSSGLVIAMGGGQVTITPQKPAYAIGEQVTLEAIPASGWEFVEWRLNSSVAGAAVATTENPLSITIDGVTTYQPIFRPQGASDQLYLPLVAQQ